MSTLGSHIFMRLAALPRWLPVALALTGCVSAGEFESLKGTVNGLRKTNEQQQHEIGLLKEEYRRIWRGLRCTNQQVADFMTEAEKCARGQCPQRNLDRVLAFMIDQRHVLVRLKPGQSAKDMAPFRISQLQDMLKPSDISTLTRFLILTMPVSLSREDSVSLPEARGEQLLHFVRRDLQLAPGTGAVGPFLVNCEQKSQLLESYSRRAAPDKPVPQEPKSREPQIAIWIFKVDCG